MVTIIGPFSLGSIVDVNPIILSGIKVGIALVLIFVSVKTHTKIKTRAIPTLIPDEIIGLKPPILPNENGPMIVTINPPPINIKTHMVKIKL